MDEVAALALCERWLPLWTGNRPEALIEVYAEDAYYRDPVRPKGLRGREALVAYFRKLLAANPDWVWSVDAVFPISGGFTLRWKARVPVGAAVVEEAGLDLVLVDGDLISHNEVYFDRTALLAAITAQRGKQL